jgi:hypothetical protein
LAPIALPLDARIDRVTRLDGILATGLDLDRGVDELSAGICQRLAHFRHRMVRLSAAIWIAQVMNHEAQFGQVTTMSLKFLFRQFSWRQPVYRPKTARNGLFARGRQIIRNKRTTNIVTICSRQSPINGGF